jgi:CxxC-x17-CxxC domain-containing protein
LFFREKGFVHSPKRCKRCMAMRKTTHPKVRNETRLQCAGCGNSTTVPFVPSQGRPVLCHACFNRQRAHPTIPPAGANSPML